MKIKMKPQIKIMNHEQTQFLYERLRIVKKLVLSSFNLAFINYLILIVLIAIFISCGENYTSEQKEYIASIEKQRQEKDDYMKADLNSPFNFKGKVEFHPLKYFDVNPNFVFKSKLFEYPVKDTISIFGTKGEERKVVRYGFVSFNYQKKSYRLNVYKGSSKSGDEYFSIWFTDKTTNEESYGVGRYLDFKLYAEKDFIYTIDFNIAYNPYCAYSPDYTCAIPTKEDYVDLEIETGEKKYH
ncbi:MAG: hypothetical protein A2W11_02305 [Ignavibacteria bacterium RBG_16_35_7]|nr:MAG: hypothetical protein A2W11_02305 [Ignavibacteria bacterium RBG_16_35_7]